MQRDGVIMKDNEMRLIVIIGECFLPCYTIKHNCKHPFLPPLRQVRKNSGTLFRDTQTHKF